MALFKTFGMQNDDMVINLFVFYKSESLKNAVYGRLCIDSKFFSQLLNHLLGYMTDNLYDLNVLRYHLIQSSNKNNHLLLQCFLLVVFTRSGRLSITPLLPW